LLFLAFWANAFCRRCRTLLSCLIEEEEELMMMLLMILSVVFVGCFFHPLQFGFSESRRNSALRRGMHIEYGIIKTRLQ